VRDKELCTRSSSWYRLVHHLRKSDLV